MVLESQNKQKYRSFAYFFFAYSNAVPAESVVALRNLFKGKKKIIVKTAVKNLKLIFIKIKFLTIISFCDEHFKVSWKYCFV